MFKSCLYGLLAIGVALVLTPQASAYSGSYTPGAGINNTVHDLGVPNANGMIYPSNATADATLQRKCIWCHAPHNTYKLNSVGATGGGPSAPAAFDYLPLWNHDLTNFTTGFLMYDNGTGGPQTGPKALQAKNAMTPGNVSLLCLSCHDGSIAINSYGNNLGQIPGSVSTGVIPISLQYQIGKDKYLGNHHPIGFDYGLVQAVDTEIREADLWLMTATEPISSYLSNGKMECATCHSVHNKGNSGERLLWRSDKNSELCLTCHDKGQYTFP